LKLLINDQTVPNIMGKMPTPTGSSGQPVGLIGCMSIKKRPVKDLWSKNGRKPLTLLLLSCSAGARPER
jgi:hypothetical protein